MMFNDFDGRVCEEDGTILFDVNDWSCTDPDNMQFCRKISDTEFEYIQLKPDCPLDVSGKGKNALDLLWGRTYPTDWYQDIIDVTDYTEQEIKEYLAPYGLPENMIDNQIIAECIFETDTVMAF